jgi:hypothetical protein
MTTIAQAQLERQRALAYADVCTADAVKARRALDRALAEEATALAALEQREEQLRAALADARRG